MDEKTRKELDQVVEELSGSTSEVIRKAIHLAWFTTMQDRMRRESAKIANDPAEREKAEQLREWPVTLLRKGSIFLIAVPARTGDHTQEERRNAVVVTASNFTGTAATQDKARRHRARHVFLAV